jgi:hypothetical protein
MSAFGAKADIAGATRPDTGEVQKNEHAAALHFAKAVGRANVVTTLDEPALANDAPLQLVAADEIALGTPLASHILHCASKSLWQTH